MTKKEIVRNIVKEYEGQELTTSERIEVIQRIAKEINVSCEQVKSNYVRVERVNEPTQVKRDGEEYDEFDPYFYDIDLQVDEDGNKFFYDLDYSNVTYKILAK